MPVPQGPRRAVPPRKKSSQKQTPPAETEATTSLPEKDTPIHDSSDIIPESLSAPVPVPAHVEPEVGAADPSPGVYASAPEYVDEALTEDSSRVAAPPAASPEAGSGPVPPPPSSLLPPLDSRPESSDEPQVDSEPMQDIPPPNDIAKSAVPPIPTAQEETDVEEVVVSEHHEDESLVGAAQEEDEQEYTRIQRISDNARAAKIGESDPYGEQPVRSASLGEEPPYVERDTSSEVLPVQGEGATPETGSAALVAPSTPYAVFQQGGDATAVNEEDDGNDGKY